MNEYTLAMLVYGVLQGVSLALLPGWWKLAAAPALALVPMIVHEHFFPSYMSETFIVLFVIFGCAYLVLVWICFGVTKLVQSRRQAPSTTRGSA